MTKFLATSIALVCLSASPDHLTGVYVSDVLGANATAETAPPDWIKVAPRGRFTARDGRSFEVDPEALVSRFEADGVAVAVDLDHSTAKKTVFGEAAPALGWIEKLQARPDGLYARVDWLDEGKRVLAARTHRYISPAFPKTDDGRVTWLHSAGLVATPAVAMPAVASATTTEEPPMTLVKIATLLSLSAAADEASCLAAIETLQKRIDPAIHQQTLTELATATASLTTLQADIRKGKVETLMEDALKAKKITPAQRASYEALCVTDTGFDQVKAIFETLGASLQASGLDDKKTPEGGVTTLSAEDREVMRQMGLTEEQFRKANGLTAA